MLGRGSYCFTGCCKGEGLKSRRAASAGCWAGSCRCPQLFKTIPPLFRCASPGGCCGRQGAKQHELWSGSVVPSGFCSRWTLQEPCSDRGLDRLGGAGAWAWRQGSVSGCCGCLLGRRGGRGERVLLLLVLYLLRKYISKSSEQLCFMGLNSFGGRKKKN